MKPLKLTTHELEADNARLRETLRKISGLMFYDNGDVTYGDTNKAPWMARKTLEGTDETNS